MAVDSLVFGPIGFQIQLELKLIHLHSVGPQPLASSRMLALEVQIKDEQMKARSQHPLHLSSHRGAHDPLT